MNDQGVSIGRAAALAAGAVATALLAGACTAQRPVGEDVPDQCTAGVEHVVLVEFDGANCPVDVDVQNNVCDDPADDPDPAEMDVLCTRRGKQIRWRAVDAAGDRIALKFEIIFDPIAGQPLHSNANGCLRRPIANNAPKAVTYKYSVLRTGSDCDALDPKVVVQP